MESEEQHWSIVCCDLIFGFMKDDTTIKVPIRFILGLHFTHILLVVNPIRFILVVNNPWRAISIGVNVCEIFHHRLKADIILQNPLHLTAWFIEQPSSEPGPHILFRKWPKVHHSLTFPQVVSKIFIPCWWFNHLVLVVLQGYSANMRLAKNMLVNYIRCNFSFINYSPASSSKIMKWPHSS